jgi:hypothetical protein
VAPTLAQLRELLRTRGADVLAQELQKLTNEQLIELRRELAQKQRK